MNKLLIGALALVAAAQVILAQPRSDECANNSLDTGCHAASKLDDAPRLTQRLVKYDKLAQADTIDRVDANDWRAQGVDSSLRQVLIVHRHGDRTPIVFPPKDALANEPFWTFHGLGQLTNKGKARLHLLGKLVRARYDNFMSGSVNKNSRVSRASGSLRCIESAESFLSGFLGLDWPNSSDSERLVWDKRSSVPLAGLWQPAAIQSLPAAMDGMLNEGAKCKRLEQEYEQVIDKTDFVRSIFDKYAHERQVIDEVSGDKLYNYWQWFWSGSLIEVERSYFPEKMPAEIVSIYDRVQEASNMAMTAYQSTVTSKRLRAGLLMGDMVRQMTKMRDEIAQSGVAAKAKKFMHYSGHDMTLVVLLGMLDQWKNFAYRPDYAANLNIELHEDSAAEGAERWYVRLFYMPHVPSKPVELHLDQCEHNGRCTLDMFQELMSIYSIGSWQDWMRECGNDFAALNPYADGH